MSGFLGNVTWKCPSGRIEWLDTKCSMTDLSSGERHGAAVTSSVSQNFLSKSSVLGRLTVWHMLAVEVEDEDG